MSAQSNVVILFGGTSSERMVSVASGQHLAAIWPEAELWFWSPAGKILSVDASELAAHQKVFDSEFAPSRAMTVGATVEAALDQASGKVFYLGLHGGDGENGWLQERLEARKICFTGSSAAASALAMNKSKSKDAVRPRGALMARQLVFVPKDGGAGQALKEFQKSVGELVIKPASEGSSAGLAFIKGTADCDVWFETNKFSGATWLAEERIYGRELTVGVMAHKGCLTVLPPSEVILERNANFDYQAKYLGVGNKEITPAELTLAQATAAQELSILAHTAIGCFGYTRTDMIMTQKGMYYLETNTLPGMTKASFIPQQLAAAGVSVRDFMAGQIELAKRRYE